MPRPKNRVSVMCFHCKRIFSRNVTIAKRAIRHFCNNSCRLLAQRKNPKYIQSMHIRKGKIK